MPLRLIRSSRRVALLPDLAAIDFLIPFTQCRGMAGVALRRQVDEDNTTCQAGPSTHPDLQQVSYTYERGDGVLPSQAGSRRSTTGSSAAIPDFESIFRPKPRKQRATGLYTDAGARAARGYEQQSYIRSKHHGPKSAAHGSAETLPTHQPPNSRTSSSTTPHTTTTTTESPSSRSPPWADSRSFTHHILSSPDPPSARAIVDYLRQRPSLINNSSLFALGHYARRTSDKPAAAVISKAQLGLNGWANRRQRRPKVKATAQKWCYKSWPPFWVEHPTNVYEALCDLHYRLLHVSEQFPAPTIEWALATVQRAASLEKRGRKGLEESERDVVHLFITYADSLPGQPRILDVLEHVLPFCRPSKQTLHLAVVQLLSPRRLQPPPRRPDPDKQREDRKKRTVGEEPEPKPKKKVVFSPHPDVSEELDRILHIFQAASVWPGTETYRIILMYASHKDKHEMAHMAFKGYWKAARQAPTFSHGEGHNARFAHTGKRWIKFRNQLKYLETRGWVKRDQGAPSRELSYIWVRPPIVWPPPSSTQSL